MALKIYTKTGDDGSTGLFGGDRVPKYHPRIEAYGTVDELNAVIGLALTTAVPEAIRPGLEWVSSLLFTVGADLATPRVPPPQYAIPRIEEQHIAYIEQCIDSYEQQLPPLKNFILPGGTPTSAYLHLARTVCRRAERRTVELMQQEDIGTQISTFLNRLSDYLFVAARYANHLTGGNDIAWRNPNVALH
jgi:cob(I)alamin adenosyltransferase